METNKGNIIVSIGNYEGGLLGLSLNKNTLDFDEIKTEYAFHSMDVLLNIYSIILIYIRVQ